MSADRVPSLRGIPWHLPYNWGKSTENPQDLQIICTNSQKAEASQWVYWQGHPRNLGCQFQQERVQKVLAGSTIHPAFYCKTVDGAFQRVRQLVSWSLLSICIQCRSLEWMELNFCCLTCLYSIHKDKSDFVTEKYILLQGLYL